MWFYEVSPLLILPLIFGGLFLFALAGYRLGIRWDNPSPVGNPRYLSEGVPATILGLLALILAFTFSMTISRFEHRRQLVIDEANAIGTTYLRATTLQPPHDQRITDLLRRYVDWRIESYRYLDEQERRQEAHKRVKQLQKEIWAEVQRAVSLERTVLESIFITSLNQMFDLENERSFALLKTLPPIIYWTILLIAGVGVAAHNFVRGQRREAGQWQVAILIALVSLMVYIILDLDTPISGQISISQDAMTALRGSL